MMKILHSADWHLDTAFVGRTPEQVKHLRAELLQIPDKVCSLCKNEGCDLLLLAGDLMNNATKTSVSNVFEEVMRPSEAKRQLVTALTPLRERILCGLPGNHERRNRDVDDDPMYDIMCKLDLEHLYRENMAFVKVGGSRPWQQHIYHSGGLQG